MRYTAAIIAQSCQTEHKVDVRFNDRDYGRWTGQPKTDVIAQWGTVGVAPGVEPTSSILSRARPVLDAGAEQAQACDHTLIVVTHDAVIRPLLINIAPALPLPNVPTGSYQLLRRHQTTWHIERTDQLPLMPPAAGRQIPARHHFSRHHFERAIGLVRQASGWSLNTR